jgi:hypothetical protein
MFESFSELSRLYAQNYPVIEAVKTEFQREVDAFLNDVQKAILAATSGASHQKITSGFRYWWIGGPDKDRHPQVFVFTSAPQIMHPGEVTLNVIAPNASADQLHALVAVARKPEFAAIHRPWNGGPWSLFKAVVTYENENPVEPVSRITASLLLALNDLYLCTSTGAAASGRAPIASPALAIDSSVHITK